jgi:hypothetical protein
MTIDDSELDGATPRPFPLGPPRGDIVSDEIAELCDAWPQAIE